MTPLAAWFASFLVHSTLLTLGALVACSVFRGPRARALILRGAVLGAFVTASLVGRFGFGPSIGVPIDPGPSAGAEVIGIQAARPGSVTPVVSAAADIVEAPLDGGGTSAVAEEPVTRGAWPFGPALAALALLGLARFAIREALARRALARRTPIDVGPLTGVAAAAGLRATGFRLSESNGLSAPLALGSREVVLPVGLLDDLRRGEVDALLAHELSHLMRRDPLWLGIARLVVAATWFQPLQHVLMRRLVQETEFAADAWAREGLGQPLDLARCIERVASRMVHDPAPAASAAMAAAPSVLVERVERLVADPAPERLRGKVMAVVLSVGGLLAMACAGPSIEARGASALNAEATRGHRLTLVGLSGEAAVQIDGGEAVTVADAVAFLEEAFASEGPSDLAISLGPVARYSDFRTLVDEATALGFTHLDLVDDSGEAFESHQWLARYRMDTLGPSAARDSFVLDIDEKGGWGVHGEAPPDRDEAREIITTIAASMPKLASTGGRTPAGQLTLNVHPAAPFEHVQRVLESCAHPDNQLWNIGLTSPGAASLWTDISLPFDVPVAEEVEELEEEILEEMELEAEMPEEMPEERLEEPLEAEPRLAETPGLVIRRSGEDELEFTLGPRRTKDESEAIDWLQQLAAVQGATRVSIDVRTGPTVAEILPVLHQLDAGGLDLMFTASYSSW